MVGRVISPSSILPFVKSLQHGSSASLRLGVCVSGGADSMVLAYLLKQVELLKVLETGRLTVFGLIVDHKARSNSTDEAHLVGQNLQHLGIRSEILTMSWPQDVDPLKLPSFESQARSNRYQLLASAALKHRVQHLFLGHHQDDQVETILMRLIRNQNTTLKGLLGMATSSAIPVPSDSPGVHISQGLLLPARGTFPPTSKFYDRRRELWFRQILPGGITLQRPLLPYSKSDILATCEAHNIPYVEDPTNKDPTTSLRNAVRHLRTNYRLPRALNVKRILKLQHAAREYVDLVDSVGKAILSTCKITMLDYRSGVMHVHFPQVTCTTPTHSNGCGYAVSKLTEVVTPNVRVQDSTQVPPHVLSHFCDSIDQTRNSNLSTAVSKSFVYDKVQFLQDAKQPEIWILSRQPMRNVEVAENTRSFSVEEASICKSKLRPVSKWLLWDNRYWIRISVGKIDSMDQIQIRPLQVEDMSSLFKPSQLGDRDHGHILPTLSRLLQQAAPGKIRLTLPILTYKNKIVAFPTFDIRLQHALSATGLSWLEWQVCYNSFSLLSILEPLNKELSPQSFTLSQPFETKRSTTHKPDKDALKRVQRYI